MIILWSSISSLGFAQNPKDRGYLSRLENAFYQDGHKHDWKAYLQNARNEGEFTFSLLFLFYKTVFSSQDIDACVFTPSCSVYMMEAIQKHGILRGFFEGQDRLTRCHPFANGKYPLNTKTHKLHDPVE
jgi:putative membrane protein insertion efficiency factor